MAESNPSGPPVHDAPATEFDLREGILVLAIWWREILCLAIFAMVMGTVWYVVTLEYEAVGGRGRAACPDRRRFRRPNASRPFPNKAGKLRRSCWQGGTRCLDWLPAAPWALAVSEHLNEQATDFQWQPAALLKSVDAELVGARGARNTRGETSAMVRITARAGSPSHAALIANAWAEAYVNLVNTLFAPNSAWQLDSITDELVQAQQAYDAAQRELEAFVAANEARSLEQEIRAKVAVVEGYFDSEIQGLNENRATRRRLGRILAAVQSMRAEVDAGGEAGQVSNTLAIQLLKVEAYVMAAKITPPMNKGDDRGSLGNLTSLVLDFNDSSGLTLDVSFGGTHADAVDQQADLEALDHALRSWLAALDQTIAVQGANLLSSGSYSAFPPTVPGPSNTPVSDDDAPVFATIEGHYEAIRSLEARLEALGRQEEQLTSQRDRLFTALDVLLNKEAELRLAAVVSQPELRLASPAVQPLLLPAIGTHLLSPAMISAVVGLTLGAAMAFLGNLLVRGPFLVPNRTGEGNAAILP